MPIDPHHVAEIFIEGFALFQRRIGPVTRHERDSVPYLEFAAGRRGSHYRYEFIPFDDDFDRTIAVARDVAGDVPHLVSALGEPARGHVEAYAAAGYEHWGTEIVMVHSLESIALDPGDERATSELSIDDGVRIEAAMREAGMRPHPVSPGHLTDPALRHRWVEDEGQPAAFGRVALVNGDAYLSDIVTMPEFRRRGHAGAVVSMLLADARAAGAASCVLSSTPMAERVYRETGFEDVMPLVGFNTPTG